MSWDTDLISDYVTDAFDEPLTDEEIAKYSKKGMAETDENTEDQE
jgi:hypothetical protein